MRRSGSAAFDDSRTSKLLITNQWPDTLYGSSGCNGDICLSWWATKNSEGPAFCNARFMHVGRRELWANLQPGSIPGT